MEYSYVLKHYFVDKSIPAHAETAVGSVKLSAIETARWGMRSESQNVDKNGIERLEIIEYIYDEGVLKRERVIETWEAKK